MIASYKAARSYSWYCMLLGVSVSLLPEGEREFIKAKNIHMKNTENVGNARKQISMDRSPTVSVLEESNLLFR